MPLLHLLRTSRQTLTSLPSPLPIVLGNTACDLDSFASSLLYSLLTPLRPRPIPLLSIPHADLSLRPDILHLLRLLSIPASSLLFTSDLPAHHPLSVHLVDHNSNPSYPDVQGIIDHHTDEGANAGASPRVVQKAGSCVSLVFKHFNAGETVAVGERGIVARLVMAPVVVDTANLGDAATTTEVDREVVGVVEGWGTGLDRGAFFAEMMAAKRDVGGMAVRDLLRKDYKEWEERGAKAGFSSVVKGMGWLVGEKDGFIEGVREWAGEKGVDVAVVMTTDGEGSGFRRELMVWGITEKGREALRAFVEKAEGSGLDLKVWDDGKLDGDDGNRRVWKQGNVGMSRKQVAPLMRSCINTRESKV